MEYTLRHLTENDYETLSGWWKFWWKQTVHRKALPDNMGDGIMISVDGEPACAGFLYATSSSHVFMMEFIISSNKIRDKEARKKALDYTVKCLIELAKKAGAISIFSSIKHPNLIKVYQENGFVVTDKSMTNMIYNFNQ